MSSTNSQPLLTGYKPKDFWSAPKRNFHSSARLRMQHALFVNTLGGRLLHPDIEASVAAPTAPDKVLRIADIGVGNGIWLIDLHEQLKGILLRGPGSYQLDGLDVNTVNFPPAETLPETIRLFEADVFDEDRLFKLGLLGAYDVVHVRTWCSLVRDNDPSASTRAFERLLKPGGYIQWEESRVDLQTTVAYPPTAPRVATDKIVALMAASGKATGNRYEFIGKLGECLTRAGFEEVTERQEATRPADYKAWTENYLIAWEDIIEILPTASQAPGGTALTREAFMKLFAECVDETERGAVVHHQAVVMVTGRKPM